MIKFEFEATDAEAEELFDLVREAIVEAVERARNPKTRAAERLWWENRAEHLKALRDKMQNKRVES